MTNVLKKVEIQEAIKNFQITDVIENGDEIIVEGNNGLHCLISKDDVLHHHLGATGYTADRFCDRANSYYIPAYELWNDGTDEGDPGNMVADVFHELDKEWRDEDEVAVALENVYCGGRVKVWDVSQKAIRSWDSQKSNSANVQKVIDAGFWIESIRDGEIICRLYDQTEIIEDDQFPRIKFIRPSKNEVVFHRKA